MEPIHTFGSTRNMRKLQHSASMKAPSELDVNHLTTMLLCRPIARASHCSRTSGAAPVARQSRQAPNASGSSVMFGGGGNTSLASLDRGGKVLRGRRCATCQRSAVRLGRTSPPTAPARRPKRATSVRTSLGRRCRAWRPRNDVSRRDEPTLLVTRRVPGPGRWRRRWRRGRPAGRLRCGDCGWPGAGRGCRPLP
jgi:hypothetical protein